MLTSITNNGVKCELQKLCHVIEVTRKEKVMGVSEVINLRVSCIFIENKRQERPKAHYEVR